MSKTDFDFTDDELSALSDEEKEALGIEIDADNGGQSLDDDDDDDNLEISGEEAVKQTDEEKQTPEAVEPETKEEVTQQQQEDVALQPTLVDSYKAVTEAIETLGVEMENGDIGFAEYNKRLNELIGYKTRIEIAYENEQQAQTKATNDWNAAQDKFFSDESNAVFKEKPLLYSTLSTAVSEIANSNEAKGKSHDWILQQAKARVESELGVTIGGAKQPATQPAKKALDTVNLPKTLGNIPASQANDSGNEFAYLDRLKPEKLEEALSKMKPEDLNRYLAQN